jgi:hypothetical protein
MRGVGWTEYMYSVGTSENAKDAAPHVSFKGHVGPQIQQCILIILVLW